MPQALGGGMSLTGHKRTGAGSSAEVARESEMEWAAVAGYCPSPAVAGLREPQEAGPRPAVAAAPGVLPDGISSGGSTWRARR